MPDHQLVKVTLELPDHTYIRDCTPQWRSHRWKSLAKKGPITIQLDASALKQLRKAIDQQLTAVDHAQRSLDPQLAHDRPTDRGGDN
jgi:hypothetical protein